MQQTTFPQSFLSVNSMTYSFTDLHSFTPGKQLLLILTPTQSLSILDRDTIAHDFYHFYTNATCTLMEIQSASWLKLKFLTNQTIS